MRCPVAVRAPAPIFGSNEFKRTHSHPIGNPNGFSSSAIALGAVEQQIKVRADALPVLGQGLGAGAAGQRGQQRADQPGVLHGFEPALGFQRVQLFFRVPGAACVNSNASTLRRYWLGNSKSESDGSVFKSRTSVF